MPDDWMDQVRSSERDREFLIEIMPLMFIPAGVGLMVSWGTLKPVLIPVCVITVVTIITVMAMTGRLSQWIIRKDRKKEEQEDA